MKRRKFLKNTLTTAIATPLFLNGQAVSGLTSPILNAALKNVDNDKILILIQLNGGNDGLNMVIPLDQYSNLLAARGDIALPENTVHKLTDKTGLHPIMEGFHNLYDQEKLAVVQSVGYPNPNFSHFRATDIWTAGSGADEFIATGWLGRYFDINHPEYPTNYPNETTPDPLAISIGSIVSNTCQGPVSNFSIAINNLEEFTQLLTEGTGASPDTPYGHELDFLRLTMLQTNQYLDTIQAAAEKGTNLSSLYQDFNSLAQQLKIVAQLISGGMQTKVYVVNLGGFDTHASQVEEADTTQGVHADLMYLLSDAIAAFQDDLKLMDLEDKVVGMTFSEFGRRIQSNGSFGTDHGAAAPMMVFGTQVNSQIFGDNPEIPDEVDVKDSVPMQFDFRSVYGSILMDWFEITEDDVKGILIEDFQYIPILKSVATDIDNPDFVNGISALQLHNNYPNPFTANTTIAFSNAKAGMVSLTLFNAMGQKVKVLANDFFAAGDHEVNLSSRGLYHGTYYCRLQGNGEQKVKMIYCVK
ncbi:MAG: DUF1501 domain-containing protein [Chitinophagales bacterium]